MESSIARESIAIKNFKKKIYLLAHLGIIASFGLIAIVLRGNFLVLIGGISVAVIFSTGIIPYGKIAREIKKAIGC